MQQTTRILVCSHDQGQREKTPDMNHDLLLMEEILHQLIGSLSH